MTDGNRGKSNARLRIQLDQIIEDLPIGETINVYHLSQEFQKRHKQLIMNSRRASSLIRERDDCKWIDHGIWMKVPVR